MDDIIDLEVLGKNGDRVLEELEGGKLIAARSKDDFLYILERGGTYHVFTHAVGSARGGKQALPQGREVHGHGKEPGHGGRRGIRRDL